LDSGELIIGGRGFAEISNIGNSVKAEEFLNYTAKKSLKLGRHGLSIERALVQELLLLEWRHGHSTALRYCISCNSLADILGWGTA
jgi:hypothetical protein